MTDGPPATIRPATPEDAHAVENLLQDEQLQSAFVHGEFQVAEVDDVVGCARLIPHPDGTHELASVAVAPAHRGRGIGHRLVQETLGKAEGRVEALALDPDHLANHGFVPSDDLHPGVEAKLDTCCAGLDVTPMVLERGT